MFEIELIPPAVRIVLVTFIPPRVEKAPTVLEVASVVEVMRISLPKSLEVDIYT